MPLDVSSFCSRSHRLQHVPAAPRLPLREAVPQTTVFVPEVGIDIVALGHLKAWLNAQRAKHYGIVHPAQHPELQQGNWQLVRKMPQQPQSCRAGLGLERLACGNE